MVRPVRPGRRSVEARKLTLVGSLVGDLWMPGVRAQMEVREDLDGWPRGSYMRTAQDLWTRSEVVDGAGDFRAAKLTADSFVQIDHDHIRRTLARPDHHSEHALCRCEHAPQPRRVRVGRVRRGGRMNAVFAAAYYVGPPYRATVRATPAARRRKLPCVACAGRTSSCTWTGEYQAVGREAADYMR